MQGVPRGTGCPKWGLPAAGGCVERNSWQLIVGLVQESVQEPGAWFLGGTGRSGSSFAAGSHVDWGPVACLLESSS